MTLIYESDLSIPKLYFDSKMNIAIQGFQKLEHYSHIDTQTYATENIITHHSQVVSGRTASNDFWLHETICI